MARSRSRDLTLLPSNVSEFLTNDPMTAGLEPPELGAGEAPLAAPALLVL